MAVASTSSSNSEDGRFSPSSTGTSEASSSSSSRSSSPPPSEEELKVIYPSSFPAIPEDKTPLVTAQADAQTPDRWIHRNTELIRLTGKHPFNAEAPLSALFRSGFLTPAHLHFVRNHGAVPQVSVQKSRNWRIRIHGLIEHEVEFSIADLKEKFEVVTLPVTLVCAGNRRKEQNVLRKSLGFDWGSAGLSTALWTGVYLADILAHVKPLRSAGAKHVIFEGGDSLPNGPYGTSQRLTWASNREKGYLVAWAMNGRPLEPDHGFPVRMVIPGQIGGRSVKWLKRIEVSAVESQHHLHFFDNKVLPTQLTPEQARSAEEKKWWYDPKYIITELNVNSAIAKPAHEETLTLDSSISTDSSTYTLKGYAYSGGGRRINRVEISMDDGHSWRLADVDYPEDLYRAVAYSDPVFGRVDLNERDTSFCWCFWSFDVSIADLAEATVISVRAMDESMNMQPRDMYPNPTSMMNNWWHRVCILKQRSAEGAMSELRFVHAAPVGKYSAGWMELMTKSGASVLRPDFSFSALAALQRDAISEPQKAPVAKGGNGRLVTLRELRTQPKDKPWFVVDGEVYDGTGYLHDHPGGEDSILLAAGEDASDDFRAIHSADAWAKLRQFHVGTLVKTETPNDAEREAVEDDTSGRFLSPRLWRQGTLVNIEVVNHDTCLYRFALPDPDQVLGLPTGQHVFVRLKRKDTGEVVQRAYTPVSGKDAKGFIDFLIKLYLPNDKWPQGGKMTVGFHQLQLGDALEMKGPLGSFVLLGHNLISLRGVSRKVTEFGLVCGGSGITPILQVLRGVLHDPALEHTRIWLIDANRTEEDILCREELDRLHAEHGDHRFHLHYTVSVTPSGWPHSVGRITDAMLEEHLPVPSERAMVLACGPDGMIKHTLKPGLQRCGWDIERQLVVF
ncbi:uncharacterized protein C8Q71DRAFT_707679 [Rhodofomes roseus]|uniref:Nitrate reductase n=1 Tax=Rhodofomes roseus TaxID=34475 RepID=A0ABQ8KGC7_9APHY|nr:uncharacterized protein C8Q71DRAFT_707679 [Rhodofomes roseus]KAH9836836.1 hypothetical protein C8Q71DRAFT_707679 [Rhodofomes roseus]